MLTEYMNGRLLNRKCDFNDDVRIWHQVSEAIERSFCQLLLLLASIYFVFNYLLGSIYLKKKTI